MFARTGVIVAAVCGAASTAVAQQRMVPPENNDGITGKPWLTGFVMLVLLAVVLVGAFLKSKRGHQD